MLEETTVFESFEVSQPNEIVMRTSGKLLCSYPGPAIAVPCRIVEDPHFRKELANFLVHMNVDILDSTLITVKAGSESLEIRDTPHPRYITQLLTEILRGVGQAADVTRIQKRIADDVIWKSALKPWRRSPLWLVIRVAMQTSLYSPTDGHSQYKSFMAFFMANILQRALTMEFPSDLIFCMRAKMSRRLYKLGSVAPDVVLQTVRNAGIAAENVLQKRWSEVQDGQSVSPRWDPEALDITADTRLSLSNSKLYLSKVLQDSFPRHSSDSFSPDHYPRFPAEHIFDTSRDGLPNAFEKNGHIALADFERGVQDHFDQWVNNNLRDPSGCEAIKTCIDKYTDAALKAYHSNPEYLSIMLLTVFHLWVGLDRLVIEQYPLLRQYSPGIPCRLLEPLLLRKPKSFERLRSIESYIRERHGRALLGSVFDGISSDSFAVRYFESSAEHQSIRLRIEQDAGRQRQAKIEELNGLNDRHRALERQAASWDHEYGFNGYHYPWFCSKCSLTRQAENLKINVYEWPLPQSSLEAKTVVFELSLPLAFSVWRATTYKILRDICNMQSLPQEDAQSELSSYQALQAYQTNQVSQITLASTTKSFLVSHYRQRNIPADAADVCFNHGLRWRFVIAYYELCLINLYPFRLFDNSKREWPSSLFSTCSIRPYCTLQIPAGIYRCLQYAVDTSSHTSNEVLSKQSECPRELTLHEYIAFASVRSGPRIQWLNIARELPVRALSFRTEAVHTLIMQAAWQVGPLSSDGGNREWHDELNLTEFGLLLLNELRGLFGSICENWQEVVSMRTITGLTSRLLASTNDDTVRTQSYDLMRDVREVTIGWMRQLTQNLRDSKSEAEVKEFQLRVLESGATCRGMYDVDPDHILHLLDSTNDVAILIESAILVHNNTPPHLSTSPIQLQQLIYRDCRLSHSLEVALYKRISECRDGLDRAIECVWAGYRPGKEWSQLGPPNHRWIVTTTATESGKQSQNVQFNLLDGQLLINGIPLSCLPAKVVQHQTYLRILEQAR